MELTKRALPLIIISAFFIIAIASLMFSGVSISKAISIQNDVTAIFLKSIQSSDVVSAMAGSAIFILQDAVFPLLPFLVFSVIGFIAVLWLKPDTKKLLASLGAVFVFTLVLALALGMNLAFLVLPLGFFALLLPVEFEERRTALKTGTAFSSYMLRFLDITLAIALFMAIIAMPDFDKTAEQQMISSVSVMLPDVGQLQQAQSEVATSFINQASSDVKAIVDRDYSSLSQDRQAQCLQFKDTIKSSVDSYKSKLLSQLQAGNASIGTEQLAQDVFSKVGIFSAMAKALPLLAALSLFILLELLRPVLALLGGAAYSLVSRKFGK